ncbi:DUF1266 domain-containing protein [Metabacillus bambusae]|uniref:DUF1266 domain-containing protein n=1 Tax=Metabacillus bambusae TaxID=2795218 RepID=A0ABS3NAG6_9BACI|nr:DUF1266 domain-containing protein [Metabacillus bambusae]MBO1515271.1 DUF1266 domain-containing protein [Metabacillus bambusae]
MASLTRKENKAVTDYLYGLTTVCYPTYYAAVNQRFTDSKRYMKGMLKQRNLDNTNQLKIILDWLIYEGRREDFIICRNELLMIPEYEREDYIQSLNNEKKVKMSLTNQYYRRLPAENIGAFDFANCILFSRFGMKLGYFTKEEARDYMMKAALLAQNSYSSWMEYLSAYFVGLQFNNQEDEEKLSSYMKYRKDFISKLIASKYSPLHKVKWDIEI